MREGTSARRRVRENMTVDYVEGNVEEISGLEEVSLLTRGDRSSPSCLNH